MSVCVCVWTNTFIALIDMNRLIYIQRERERERERKREGAQQV